MTIHQHGPCVFYEDGYATPDLEGDFLQPLRHFSEELARHVFSIQQEPKPDDMSGKEFRDQQVRHAASMFTALLGEEVEITDYAGNTDKYVFDLTASRVVDSGPGVGTIKRTVSIVTPKFDDMFWPALDNLKSAYLKKLEE